MSLFPRWLRIGFDALVLPIARWLGTLGATPNVITTVGAMVLVAAGAAFASGNVRAGGALLLLSGLFDMLDGKLARDSGRVTPFGAFYDSTLDRVGESALYLGIALFFLQGGVPAAVVPQAVAAAILALAGSLLVSYTRARAEGLNLECKVGILQRAERIVGLGAPTLFFSAGPDGRLLLAIVALLAVLSFITVVQRILHVRRLTRSTAPESIARRHPPVLADPSRERTPL